MKTAPLLVGLLLAAMLPARADVALLDRELTVLVTVSSDRTTLIGSGVVIGRDSMLTIVTAAHVIRPGSATYVTTPDGDRMAVHSIVLLPGHDLALIRAASPAVPPVRVPLLGRAAADHGRVFLWGHPRGHAFTLAWGNVLDPAPDLGPGPDGRFTIECQTCDLGDSGAGVFDEHGALLGILTQLVAGADGRLTGVGIVESVDVAARAVGERPHLALSAP